MKKIILIVMFMIFCSSSIAGVVTDMFNDPIVDIFGDPIKRNIAGDLVHNDGIVPVDKDETLYDGVIPIEQ